jgi:hypothetical protein
MKTGKYLWVLPGIVVEQQCCIIFLEWCPHDISVLWSYADSNLNAGRVSCFRQVLSKVLNKDTLALRVVGRVSGWYPSLIQTHFAWHTNTGEDMAWKQDEAPQRERKMIPVSLMCPHNSTMLSLKATRLWENHLYHPRKLVIFLLLALYWNSSSLEMLCGTTQWIALWAEVQISEPTSHIFWWWLQRSFTFQTVDII